MGNRSERGGLIETRTLSVNGAEIVRDVATREAQLAGVSGFVLVVDNNGMELCSLVTGQDVTKTNVSLARAKAKTVLTTQRSSRLQRERMKEKGQSVEDYDGMLGSLFGGGVAIFADEELSEFVGTAAFSGGSQEEDEAFCVSGVKAIGLYTDISPKQK